MGGGRRPYTKTVFCKQLGGLRICQHEKQLFLHSSPLGLKFEVYRRLRVSSVCHLREFSPPLLLVCALRIPFPLCMPLLVKYMDVCVCSLFATFVISPLLSFWCVLCVFPSLVCMPLVVSWSIWTFVFAFSVCHLREFASALPIQITGYVRFGMYLPGWVSHFFSWFPFGGFPISNLVCALFSHVD